MYIGACNMLVDFIIQYTNKVQGPQHKKKNKSVHENSYHIAKICSQPLQFSVLDIIHISKLALNILLHLSIY